MLLESKAVWLIFSWKMLIFVAFSGTLQAQQGALRPQAHVPQVQDLSAEIAEIEGLRKKLGGGVAETLSDLIDPAIAQKEFALELERLSGESGRSPRLESKADESIADSPKRVKKPLPYSPSAGVKLPLVFTPSSEGAVRSKLGDRALFHSIARKLDGITADLEETGYYNEADSMRDLADHYWDSARKLEPVRGDSEPLLPSFGALKEKK